MVPIIGHSQQFGVLPTTTDQLQACGQSRRTKANGQVHNRGLEIVGDALPHGPPEFRQISLDMLRLACRRAASDKRRAPLFGLFFAGFYVLLGWILVRI